MADLEFRRDLYRGTAGDYERFRPPYPSDLIEYLVWRTTPGDGAALLDLACGTGQVAFALAGWFGEIWAIDQEPDMIALARRKARDRPAGRFRFVASAAEDLSAPDGKFELITIGNAFHRLPRHAVAERSLRWLRPGGHLALLWGGTPWDGPEPWQRAVAATMRRWRRRVGPDDRVPEGYKRDRRDRPDAAILRAAGFELAGARQFPVRSQWTPGELAGFAYSTSVLSRAVLGAAAAEFEADLRRVLLAIEPSGRVSQTLWFAVELAVRPEPARNR
ncbi:MAG: class I SAM-dependent methyltransferase [Streptosporangiaceae bacterium]